MFQLKNYQVVFSLIALTYIFFVLLLTNLVLSKIELVGSFCILTGFLLVGFFVYFVKEKQLSQRKETFVATLTHDLKTPVLAQSRALELLLNDKFGELNSEQAEIIEQTKNSCEYMKCLIFTILETYLSENGKVKLCFDNFNVLQLVHNVKNELNCLATEKAFVINIISSLDSEFICADKLQIKRVVVNIISNAIFHGKSDSVINVYLENNGGDFYFRVENEFKFISDESITQMFEKYKRSSISRYNKTGTGLGLYLSKRIIEAHKGKIFAKSSANKICVVGFILSKN